MVFNDVSNGTGVIQECERITGLGTTGISGNGVLLKDFTARTNNALDRFYALAFEYDELWSLDDRKYADTDQKLPIAVTNLVSGQQDYLFASELLALEQVFVKDSSGTWREIKDQDDRTSPNVYVGATTGVPSRYELVGNSILLDPAPNYNSTGGLKVVFKRNGMKFSTTDGAVSLGIPSLFHPYLAREASLPYLIDKSKGSRMDIAAKISQDEQALKHFISNRAKPKRAGLRITQENNR